MSHLKAIVGLGNPGEKYHDTRHNAGFRILDLIADRVGESFKMEGKWEARCLKLGSTLLVQPQTFMNESGRSIGSLARFYGWKPEEILVVYDDVALALGTLRFRMKGGHAGHNGVRSLLAHLPSENFPRLKFGIGAASGEQLVGHVLGRFAVAERELLENTLATAADAVQLAVSAGVEAAANEFNVQSTHSKQKQKPADEPEIRRDAHPQDPGQ
ncbi:MAG: aminoacyl-tRNA hydrolase [Akkermansiaceae bacterium]